MGLDGEASHTLHLFLGSTLMTDRFKFWHISQNHKETIQDWEVRIRQAGSLYEFDFLIDIMCRDKNVFGLHDTTIRTELLKLLRPDGTPKVMSDVIISYTVAIR